ncbi:hypothetical protein CDAR_165971 [Caerostris darwini]|uniref:Uncharacterized protein n=1 Tax=Caerostris darwini TaxID=1538125 RepID=A0AAV4RYM1_9ARAC|nr:hypothetical protein CDAR_165971 [Caerostris darwini]
MISVGRLWAISTLFGEYVQRQAIPITSSSFQPGSPDSPEETPNPIPPLLFQSRVLLPKEVELLQIAIK